MTKLKTKDLVNNVAALKVLAETKFPVKISYQISRLLREVDAELAIFEKGRNKLVIEFGAKNEETDETRVTPENIAKFTEEYSKLEDIDVELQFAEKIKIEDLGTIDIEPKNLITWLFQD